ncbi:MAG: hypothetical protein AVDCRST_MAG56-6029 [uncultured Cytophagales bacterium]|uniref:DUF4397 domain-containing protein n=1 Tax=uncultured Cytophagales bacterium TaxID=158755 RepID=A0A6J4KL69_9SPHI|nr:MAG: hypothetical protein AVDCRST_MAG56-6029 [uncultured Cytophagales bacterium]
MFPSKNTFRLLLAAPLLGLLLGGCNPTGVDEFDGDPGKAKLMVYNVMPSFYVYQGVNKEGLPITVTNGLPLYLNLDGVRTFAGPLGYNNYTGYFPVEPGNRAFRADTAFDASTAIPKPSAPVVNSNVELAADRFYTLFVVDTLQSIETVLVEDDLTPPDPASGRAKVRFAHMSPDAPAVDVAVQGGPVLFGNQSFKGVTPFVEVDANSYNLEVRPAGTTTVALPLSNTRFDAGKMYTVVAAGRLNPQKDASGNNRNALRGEILINYYVYP